MSGKNMPEEDLHTLGRQKDWLKLNIGLQHELISNRDKFDTLLRTLRSGTDQQKDDLRYQYNIEDRHYGKYLRAAQDGEEALAQAIVACMLDNLQTYNEIKAGTNKRTSDEKRENAGSLQIFYMNFEKALTLKAKDITSPKEYNLCMVGQNDEFRQILKKTQERMGQKRLYTEMAYFTGPGKHIDYADVITEKTIPNDILKAQQTKKLKLSPGWEEKRKNGGQACKLDCIQGYTPTGQPGAPKTNLTRVDNMGMTQKEFLLLAVHNLNEPLLKIPESFVQSNPNSEAYKGQENPSFHLRFTTKEGGKDVEWGVLPKEENGRIIYHKFRVGADGSPINLKDSKPLYGYDCDRNLKAPYKGCNTVRELLREQFRHLAEYNGRYAIDLYSNVIKEDGGTPNNRAGASAISASASGKTSDGTPGSAVSVNANKNTPKPR